MCELAWATPELADGLRGRDGMIRQVTDVRKAVDVPFPILLARDLRATAKLVWMILQWDRFRITNCCTILSPTRLMDRIGLSRPTIRRAIAQLEVRGYIARYFLADPINVPNTNNVVSSTPPMPPTPPQPPQSPPPPPSPPSPPPKTPRQVVKPTLLLWMKSYCYPFAYIPLDLLTDRNIGVQAKVIYGAIQSLADYEIWNGSATFTYASLARFLKLNVKTVRRALQELKEAEWVVIRTKQKTVRKDIRACDPVTVRLMNIERRIQYARFLGETLMREGLSLVLAWDNAVDNARPEYLVNKDTGGEMHFDRLYEVQKVAFEFNGDQHYRPTDLYDKDIVNQQKLRDKVKQQICQERGITLVVFTAEDLSIEGIKRKVKGLPGVVLNDLTGYEKVIEYLEDKMCRYRNNARQHRSGGMKTPEPGR